MAKMRKEPKRPIVAAQPRSALAKVWTDSRTGKQYESRSLLREAKQARARLVLRDFEELVRERTLGQPAWEMLPGESPLAYSRFRSYMTMALNAKGERSLRVLADILGLKKKQIDKGAARYHWALRAKLWDEHLMAEEDMAFTRERKMAGRRQARLGMRLQSVASKGLQHLAENPERLADMAPMEILKMAEAGQRIERLGHGDANVITDNRVQLIWEGPQPDWAPAQADDAQQNTLQELDDGKTIEGQH